MPKVNKNASSPDITYRALLAHWMEKNGFTCQDACKRIGVSEPTMRDHRRNPGRISLREFRILCKELRLTSDQICDICGVYHG